MHEVVAGIKLSVCWAHSKVIWPPSAYPFLLWSVADVVAVTVVAVFTFAVMMSAAGLHDEGRSADSSIPSRRT